MSGLELIPIVTGIVCAVGAAKGLISGKKRDRDRGRDREGRSQRDDRNYPDGRHCRRSRSRRRSTSKSSREISLSRDTPHSVVFRWKSRTESQYFDDSSSDRIDTRTPHFRRSSPSRRSSRRRCRHRSSSHGGRRRNRRSRERQMLYEDDALPRSVLCNGRVDQIQNRSSYATKDTYICQRCNLEIVDSGIASWHVFFPRDRGEVKIHKNFILRSHEARDGKFGCPLCHDRWMPGYRSLVLHLRKHRYAELENVVPENEWIGSEDWVP